MPTIPVNGADLYYEVRGTGPAVLLIMGATGDGGHFDRLADLLADEFTVCTYDRRGNGRSPAPAGWTTTSPEEQADDAAALLNALGLGPAAVFGTSSGGNFALYLSIRHPELVRGAILHEPGLYAVLDDFDAVRAPARAVIAAAVQAGGPTAAVEAFWNYIAGNAWDQLPPELRHRLRDTATTLLTIELGSYEQSLPDSHTLTAIQIPVRLVVSERSLPFFAEIAGRLAARAGWDVATTPGGHAAYHDHPVELAATIRPFLREITAAGQPPRVSGR
jgi:pimeloyl-ACP methyl ester carboxylesterase